MAIRDGEVLAYRWRWRTNDNHQWSEWALTEKLPEWLARDSADREIVPLVAQTTDHEKGESNG